MSLILPDSVSLETAPYILHQSVNTVPLLFNIPHAGRVYPSELTCHSPLGWLTLRSSEDAYVDILMAQAAALPVSLLIARFARAFVDLNRNPQELDPLLFSPPPARSAFTTTSRVAHGLGVIPRVVGDHLAIYDAPLPLAEGQRRIERFYTPYHQQLQAIIDGFITVHGVAFIIDCHSMPSAPRQDPERADIVLGDFFGKSCAPWFTDAAETTLRQTGLRLRRNHPYAGGYITEHYGAPMQNVHVLQLEINRRLYMDEAYLSPHDGFYSLADHLFSFAQAMHNLVAKSLVSAPKNRAAE